MDKQITIQELRTLLFQLNDFDPLTGKERLVWLSVPDNFEKLPLKEIHTTEEKDLILVTS
jgi:hypothetical protein